MGTEIDDLIIDRAEANLQRQLDWIGRYDVRSATIFGVGIAMLGFLATQSSPLQQCSYVQIFLMCACAIGLATSFVAVYAGQYPRTKSANDSLIYFGNIAKIPPNEFITRVQKQTAEEHFSDLCYQAHINAVLLSKKFQALQFALISLLLASLPWALAIFLFRAN